MRVAITGAKGFVGQHLMHFLQKLKVVVLPLSRPQFDLFDVQENIRALEGVDTLIHCAALVHQMQVKPDAGTREFQWINVEGTKCLLEAANQAKVKQFIFLSTIKVNGEKTLDAPFTETDIPAPKDPYALSKYHAEQWIQANAQMPYTIIRPTMIYGSGMKGNFPRLIRLLRMPILLPFGSIHNQRSFLHVDNLCDFIKRCLLNTKAFHQIFLVADSQALSTPELILRLKQQNPSHAWMVKCPVSFLNLVATVLGKKSWVNRLTDSLVVDNQKARLLLGWYPQKNM